MKVLTVLDMAAKRFHEPYFSETLETALRSFRSTCNNPEMAPSQYPEDYALYHIGEFDPANGEITPCTRVKLANATEFAGGFGNQLRIEEASSA